VGKENDLKTRRKIFAVALLALFSVNCFADVQLLYGGNRQGAFEPCGCPVKQLGGIGRWASAVMKYRDASTLVVDAGNALLPVATKGSEAKRAVASLIAAAYRSQKLAAMAPAPADLFEGLPFLESLSLPWVSANLRRADGVAPFPAHRMITVGADRVALIGLTAAAKGEGYLVEEAKPALEKALEAAVKEKATHVVVLSSLGISETTALIGKAKLPTVVVGSATYEAPDQPRRSEHGVLGVETEPEGKHLGRVGFAGKGEIVELDAKWKSTPAVEKLITAYRKQQRVVATQATLTPDSKAKYVANAHRCQGCHQEQYDFWKKTHHASAYLVLYAKGSHFDPECVACHSLAFEQPGGFDRVALAVEEKGGKPRKTPLVETILAATFAKEGKKVKPLDSREDPKRYAALKERYHTELDRWQKQGKLEHVWAGVQCENCHGSRIGHPENGAPPFGKVPADTCKQCHHDPHHPGFDFAALQPKVACPLMKTEKKK